MCGHKKNGQNPKDSIFASFFLQSLLLNFYLTKDSLPLRILNMGVSKNNGITKSSSFTGFSTINHPFWGTPILGNIHIPPALFCSQLRGWFPLTGWSLKLRKLEQPKIDKNRSEK